MTVTFIASSQLPTKWGTFTMHGFLEEATGKEHVVLTMGDVSDGAPVLGRLHSECLTGDALFSLRCDCGFQLEAALKALRAKYSLHKAAAMVSASAQRSPIMGLPDGDDLSGPDHRILPGSLLDSAGFDTKARVRNQTDDINRSSAKDSRRMDDR